MSQIKLGVGGYRGRPEGEVCDLGETKNAELVKLGRAEWIEKPDGGATVSDSFKRRAKVLRPRRKRTYKTK